MAEVKVVDASAIAALLFGEPQADLIIAEIADATLVAPALLWYEISSVCLKKMSAYPEQAPMIRRSLALLPELQIEALAVDQDALLDLAIRCKLTICDASYLWLASQRECRLLTLDKGLAKAARKLGVN